MCSISQEKNVYSLEEILPAKLFEVLERSGICSPKQVITLSVWDIKKRTNLSTEDIHLLKTIVSNNLMPNCTTCDLVVELERKLKKVTTGCKVLDGVLKGGFRRGTITEIYGESGSGKTQIGIQASAYNWSTGSVYICTEDLFPVKRYEQIKTNLPNYSSNTDYGKNIYIEHVTEPQDVSSCIKVRLPKLLSKTKLSLIVIDSVAGPYRLENANYVHRAEELRELAVALINTAQKYNLAVVCINQVSAAFNQSIEVLPSLGLAWSNMISTRLWLKKTNQIYSMPCVPSDSSAGNDSNVFVRELSVQFSSDLPITSAKCIITFSGIVGIL